MKPTFKNQIIEAKYNVEYLTKVQQGKIQTNVKKHIVNQLLNTWQNRYQKLIQFIPKNNLESIKKITIFVEQKIKEEV
jgi:hypothetical protein